MLHEEKRLRDLANGGVGGSSSQGIYKVLYPFDFFLIPLLYIEHFAVVEPDEASYVSIQVEPYEDTPTGLEDDPQSWTSHLPYSVLSVPSQSASGQSLSSYRLLSLISPLLAVISDGIIFNKASTFTVYRLRHMFDMLLI